MIYGRLFLSFLQIGLFSIGGGYAAMPLIQAQTVDRWGWLTIQEFTNLISIAEMTPGPIAINSATFVGMRLAGLGGAVTATLGCIFPSLVIVSLLSYIYQRCGKTNAMQSVLGCLRPAVVALIASAALSILRVVLFAGQTPSLKTLRLFGLALFAAAFVLLRWKKCNPILVMAGCGVVNLLVEWLAEGV